jgi:beta-galactosidase
MLVVPPLYVASDALLSKLVDYVRNGGHVVMSFKSGFTNEYDTVRWDRAPGPLRQAAGFSYQEFSNLRQPVALKGDPFRVGGDANKVSTWAEFLLPDTAQPLAYYDHPFFGKYPALTRNKYGKGTFTYEGTFLSDALQESVLGEVLKSAGLTSSDQQLPKSVRVKHGTSNSGKHMHYYLNYSSEPATFMYSYANGADLLTNKSYSRAASITIPAWDLAVIEEGQ